MLVACGALTVGLGVYLTGPRLVEYVTEYLSEDRALSDATKVRLYALHMRIIVLGLVLAVASTLLPSVGRFLSPLISRTRGQAADSLAHLLRKMSLSFRGVAAKIYSVARMETCMWAFVLFVLCFLSIPAIFLTAGGGFHVEGIDLQPAKNLVRHGIYGTLTTRGFDDLTHRSSAGPGIILPNAVLFKVFGVNPYIGRTLHVCFVIGALLTFYATARSLYGRGVAILAMYLFTPFIVLVARGELPLSGEGYAPGLFYSLSGALLWFKALETKRNIFLVLSGLLWGLAFQTKWLFLFAVGALVLTYGAMRWSDRRLPLRYCVVPVVMVAVVTFSWFAFRVANVGLRQEILHLKLFWVEHGHRAVGVRTQHAGFGGLLESIRPLANLAQTDFTRVDLWADLQFFVMVPAMIYAAILIMRSRFSDHKIMFFFNFNALWFAWWLFLNYDLAQIHLITFHQISQLFIAKFLYDLWKFSLAHNGTFFGLTKNPLDQQHTMRYLLSIGIICIVLGKVFIPLAERAGTLYSRSITLTKPYKEMMTYITENAEKEAVFSGWDWSMPWYVDLDEKGDHIIKDRATYRPEQREDVPEYFIVSPEWPLVKVTDEWPSVAGDSQQKANERRKKFLEEHCTYIKSFGGPKHTWLLYRVNNDALGPAPGSKDRSGLS